MTNKLRRSGDQRELLRRDCSGDRRTSRQRDEMALRPGRPRNPPRSPASNDGITIEAPSGTGPRSRPVAKLRTIDEASTYVEARTNVT